MTATRRLIGRASIRPAGSTNTLPRTRYQRENWGAN